MKTTLILLAILSFCPDLTAQGEKTEKPQPTTSYFDGLPRSFRPKLTMQEGLQLSDRFIASEKIDISKYWLYQAKYIVSGKDSTHPGIPGWYFWWSSNGGELGNYVEYLSRWTASVNAWPLCDSRS